VGVEFRVLGEVEARVDGRRLDAGHARQRCVLASLLVDVNRPVSVDQLIHRVWADEPPRQVRNALAGYLSRLRQLLGDAGDVQISRGPAGYTLTADALSVDLHLFRHLAARARASTDGLEATELYRRALELWRGEPFAVLDTPWVNEIRNALEAERLSVAMDRNDAALGAGRHTELLDELVTAQQTHPLDERLAGQLMLVQYRSGRQADALDTYRQMRDRLVDELGIEPSPALQHVHQQILENDRAEAVSASAPLLPPQARPASTNLPRRASQFIGREQEVIGVTNALAQGPLVTLSGVGGVGKTTLALEVAQRSRDRYPDGVWFCELAPLDHGAAVGHAVASALLVHEKRGLGIDGTVVDFLRERQLLLVVDNCEHVLDASAQLADRITRECPQVSVLATSREALGVSGERIFPVPPLPDGAAEELFAERAKASRPDFDLDNEPVGAVAEICRRLDGIPLAIELAAARMRMMTSLDVARRLDRLRLLSGGARGAHPRQQSVTATIDWSYRLLADDEQALFERLSIFAGGFDLEAAHRVCADEDATEDDTLELLAGLVDKSMVMVRGGINTTRYDVLGTLRAYGRDRLQEKEIHEKYASRHAVYFTELIERAAAGIRGPEEQTWIERLAPKARTMLTTPDYDNVRTAFERSLAVGDHDLALRLVTSLPELVHLRIGYSSVGWAERVIEVADPDHPLFPAAVGVAARGAWVLGKFAHAKALVARAGGRVPGPGTSYAAYPADVLADLGLNEGGGATAALAHYEAEAARARAGDDPFRLVWILYKITLCHEALGTLEASVPTAQEAMEVAEGTANPTAMSMARCALGQALKESEPDRALRLFGEVAALSEPVQNNWLVGIALTESADIRAAHGEPAATARMFIEVFDFWEDGTLGEGALQWITLRYVTRLFQRLGADEEVTVLQRAIRGDGMTGKEAVAFARSSLQRYC
jgi:predicted ATPase/DNA-binding SARP family transcriptional activator